MACTLGTSTHTPTLPSPPRFHFLRILGGTLSRNLSSPPCFGGLNSAALCPLFAGIAVVGSIVQPSNEVMVLVELGEEVDNLRDSHEQFLAKLEVLENAVGINHPKRRPSSKLRVSWLPFLASGLGINPETVYEESMIEKEPLMRLLEPVGVVLDLRDSSLRFDLLKMSMQYHGIVTM
ncbi:hypothetical protein CVT25_007776 [Psilocybe cyanescens]|uniref:Uncharacterized protein n=1 Tax=Psilocybe cyanescens TaxID=93625 RepID=A0A409XHY6_PSICY|nr:hypothetical protein CVT25_007776 [Psilocybe cyanescens]